MSEELKMRNIKSVDNGGGISIIRAVYTLAASWGTLIANIATARKPVLIVVSILSLALPVLSPAVSDDIPEHFEPNPALFDYERQEFMIPMRDGVKLFTVVWRLKHATEPMPIILTRTPYDAAGRPGWTQRPFGLRGAASVPMSDAPLIENGYVLVYQDVRGKNRSEGDYIMTVPLRGPLNTSGVDQSTDAWDTIDWLVKNVPNNNGRVGIKGVSYEGWTSLMARINPHPALHAVLPMSPLADGWKGDDWYHNGAFRQFSLEYIYQQTTGRTSAEFPFGNRDAYAAYLAAGSASGMARSRGMEQLPAWKRLIDHPAYDQFWQEQAVDRLLEKYPSNVPTLTVHGLFDQEDIYGPLVSYHAMERNDKANDRNYLVIGPWFHGQQDPWFHQESGSHLGPLQWGSDTTRFFLDQVMLPFFDRFLKGKAPAEPIPPVRAFETGSNMWRTGTSWPLTRNKPLRLYLQPAGSLTFRTAPADHGFDSYISDPAKPVPYRTRPIIPSTEPDASWFRWLVDDQRPFDNRPDVLSYVTEPLTEPITISGPIMAHLVAATTGTDSDWVVKLIDVYPDENPSQPDLGGYQLMIAGDIFRGRYRESLETPHPITPGKPLPYSIRLPNANHRFLRGHRIMVQIQSSWFPVYDRNPQSFVPKIADAEPESYKTATQSIYHDSYIEMPVR